MCSVSLCLYIFGSESKSCHNNNEMLKNIASQATKMLVQLYNLTLARKK